MFGLNEAAWFSIFAITALKSAAILAAAWLAATLLRRRSSAARHLVWMAAFAALLALPFLALSLPPLRVAGTFLQPNVIFQTTATLQGGTSDARPAAGRGAVAPLHPASRRPDFLFWLMLLWAAGTAAALLQTAAAILSMARVRRRARMCAEPDLDQLTRALGIRQPVDLLEAHGGTMPMTYGPLRPAIFLPAGAGSWSPELRRTVLLHELAHVRRGDVAMHLLARTALNLYWWNPLAWLAWRAFLKEREHATDDLVLAAGARASEYAGHLLEVARTMQAAPALGWAAIAMARPSNLEGRLSAILDARIRRANPGRAAALAAAALAVALIAPLAAVRAQDPAPAQPVDINLMVTAAAQKDPGVLEAAAVVANRLKQYDVAQKLLESALNIREQASGERSADYAAGLIKLGDLERARNQRMNADAYYTKAVDVLGNQPEAAPALLHLGTDALARKDYQKATEYFQQMQIADPSQAGRSLMWQALVQQRQGDTPAAESLYRGALAVQNENSADAATTMDLYAQMLKDAGRADEAALMQGRAGEIRKTLKASAQKPLNTAGGVYRVGGGVTPPRLLSKVEPSYSDEARAAKYQGTVVVYVEIGPDGLAHNSSVMQGLGLGLDEKAIEAIGQWQFKPGTKDGVAVTVAATIEVNFKLM